MRLRHCFIASLAVLFGLASPLCALGCSLDFPGAQTEHELVGDSQEHPCHDTGPPPESDAPSESCEDRCMSLELAAAGERVGERSSPLVALLPEPWLASLLTQAPARTPRDRARPEPPTGPGILLLKSTFLI